MTNILVSGGEPVADYPRFEISTVITSSSLPNNQTGLFEQTLRISNVNNSTIDAVRILISNLPAGVEVFNAAGMQDGKPFIQYNSPLAPGQVVDLVVEYFVPLEASIPTSAVYLPLVVNPLPPVNPAGSVVTDGFLVQKQPDDRFTVEWFSVIGRTYWVQYSDDAGSTWETVLSSVTGTGLKVVWLDNGQPKTDQSSDLTPNRQYRVVIEP